MGCEMTNSVLTLLPRGGYAGWENMRLGYNSPTPIALQKTYTSSGNVLFSMEDAAVAGAISKITLKPYLTCYPESGTVTVYGKVKIGSTVYNAGTALQITDYISTPTLYNIDVTTNPKTSAAWTWDEIDDLIAGVYKVYDYGKWAYLWQFSATVTYTVSTYTPKTLTIGNVGIAPGGMIF